MTSEVSDVRVGPSGFGGWFMLVVIGQTIAPVSTILSTALSMTAYSRMMTTSDGAIAFFGEAAFSAAFLYIQISCTLAMYRRSKNFPTLFLLQWFAMIVMGIGDILLFSIEANRSPWALGEQIDLRKILSPIVTTGLWVWYVFASVRVRNTFTR